MSELLTLPKAIGNISLSPDGRTVAFERGPRLEDTIERVNTGPRVLCPCSVWLVERDGSNARQLIRDGRTPAWSPHAPHNAPAPPETPGLTPRVWIAVMRK